MPEEKQDSTEHAVQPEEVTAGELPKKDERNDADGVGARFIAPDGVGGDQRPGENTQFANSINEVIAPPATDQQPESLPPEARGELNGGPLGCCLGVVIGLMISLPVAVIGRIYANPLVPIFHSPLLVLILLRIAMAISGIAGAVILGYFGWKIGRRLYREYEPPVIKPRCKTPDF